MQATLEQQPSIAAIPFVDRRRVADTGSQEGRERRQVQDSRAAGRPDVNEFAEAVDRYKVAHHRRFITFEELYDVMVSLGYHK